MPRPSMPRLMTATILAAVASLPAGSAYASDLCTGSGEKKPESEIKAAFESQGYTIKKFGSEDGCYEIKGTDASGKKVEIYVSPWTGDTVKTKTY